MTPAYAGKPNPRMRREPTQAQRDANNLMFDPSRIRANAEASICRCGKPATRMDKIKSRMVGWCSACGKP